MIINKKYYRIKSPEAIALQATQGHYQLFIDKDMKDVSFRDEVSTLIDIELEVIKKNIETRQKVTQYVC